MNKTTRLALKATALVAIGLSITACGGSSSSRPTPPPTPPAPPATQTTESTQPAANNGTSPMRTASIPIQACDASASAFLPTFTLPARNQGNNCNSCWAYATAGAYEQNYAFKSGQAIDVSESQILDCSNKGNCTEGTWAFDFLQSTGTTTESSYPASELQKTCVPGLTPLKATQRGFVNASVPVPPVNAIKAAICAHGAVAGGVVETAAFKAHRGGGVFSETTNEPLHHAVVIVGWNDTLGAWRVRNSRTEWGEQGYGWVGYGSNSIGHSAAWVESDAPARSNAPCAPSTLSIEGGTTVSTSC